MSNTIFMPLKLTDLQLLQLEECIVPYLKDLNSLYDLTFVYLSSVHLKMIACWLDYTGQYGLKLSNEAALLV